ncbi:MAG TPA: 5-(carboxyamino)imidazole ribonucleotide mutase [Blastocatellia bacterium]|jgi:5-(carboxyamino)imidazole ribonucleotide mutase|nr:5-(carboxyamino)imidazole ribonucleotide mutase [Blastocatellia bacterium]
MTEVKKTVSILMGSASDLEIMLEAAKVLDQLGVSYDLEITSAHRSPERTRKYVGSADQRGTRVFIVGAGAAAHLAGVVAAETTLPVIGVPLAGSALNGLDALYSTVMMPAGVPVATMAIGKAGATNAAVLAAQILAVSDAGLAAKLSEYKSGLAQKVEDSAREAKKRL